MTGGWSDSQPDLHAEPYVFAAGEPPPGVAPFAVIREDEGSTVILTRSDADRAGRSHDHIFVDWTQRTQARTLLSAL